MRARQKVSRAGVELIKSFEGLRTVAARLPDGRWTLGYGHTFSAREGARVTQEDADALLRFDLLPVVDAINNLVLVPLNQNQFDALVSFCFNIGAENFAQSTVLKRINEGRLAEAALAMDSWRSAEFNGQTYVLAPLIRRRAAEKNLFLTPEEISQQAATLGRPVLDVAAETPPAAPEASHINPYAPPPVEQRQVIDLNAPARTSIDIQAALARAMDEQRRLEETQRLEAEKEAEAMRAQELQRLEAARLEQAKLEQARLEQARLEQERLEQWRQEQARIEAERAEAARLESIRAEAVRQEQIRLEQVRLEQARLEAERLERERQEAERAQAEQARLEQERRAAEETARQAVQADDEAEKARKAEAAAALMRLYSPYGGGTLGRPLSGSFARPAPTPSVESVTPAPEPAMPSGPEFTNHSVISPSTVESAPFEVSARPEPEPEVEPAPEPETPPSVVHFNPAGSASTMPPPVITALNPYANPIPAAAVAETVVEVPRPTPVDLSAPSNAPVAAEIGGLHWRDQLQRPLPQDYQPPQSARLEAEPEQPFLRAGPSSNFQSATYEDDNEAWLMNGDRIALSAEEAEEAGDSWWRMIVKTLWWIIISGIGLGFLGVATGAWWQATHDLTVMREAKVGFYTFVSISTAALGILCVSISVWLIMKRLGGLKD